MNTKLGTLKNVNLREAWNHEAQDFTPWLADNLEYLSNEIGIQLELEGQECTPYSFRHRYAYVAHNRINKNGTYRSTKQIADAMGHDLETHLKSYSRFNTKDLENAFDCVVERLETKVEKKGELTIFIFRNYFFC